MEVDLIFKIAAIGIIVAVLHQLLVRAGREEQAMLDVYKRQGWSRAFRLPGRIVRSRASRR